MILNAGNIFAKAPNGFLKRSKQSGKQHAGRADDDKRHLPSLEAQGRVGNIGIAQVPPINDPAADKHT